MGTKIVRNAVVLLLIMGSASALACQAGTPEGALEEMATATDVETLLKHFPVKVQGTVEKLPLPKRAVIVERFLVAKNAESQGGQLIKTADGRGLELVNREGQVMAAVRLKRSFVSGSDALVELEVKEQSQQWEQAMVEMHYAEGEWRLIKVGSWRGMDVESEFMPRELAAVEPDESAVASMLRTVNTALVTYAIAYPEVGFPVGLQALSGSGDQEPAQDHAMLLDDRFLPTTPIMDGYEFHYRAADQSHYQITATPVETGKGKKSFFTDESCVIRSTAEGRPANASDSPLE
jgi:hypothetical protein